MSAQYTFRFGANEDEMYLVEHSGRIYTFRELVTLRVAEYLWKRGNITGIKFNSKFNNFAIKEIERT